MRDEGEPASVQGRPPFDPAWSSDMFHFFCHMFYREAAFEDMYCFCLRQLDRMFVAMDADYADFNLVIGALKARLVEALAQRPLSFREFKRLFAAASTECDGSVHSSGCDSSIPSSGWGGVSSGAGSSADGTADDHEQLALVA